MEKGFGGLLENETDETTGSLDFYAGVKYENSVVSGTIETFKPLSGTVAPFQFQMTDRGRGSYIDLARSRLYMELQVVTDKGKPVTTDLDYSIVNDIGNALWSTVQFELADRACSELTQEEYNYHSLIQKLLSYSSTSVAGHLKASRFHVDTANNYDKVEQRQNEGYDQRKKFCEESNVFQVIGPLCAGFCQMSRYLPASLRPQITLVRASSDDFVILHKGDAKLKIVVKAAELLVPYITISDTMQNRIESSLMKQPMIFPFTKTIIKTKQIPTGNLSAEIENLFTGLLPTSIIVGMVRADSRSGRSELNPFRFQPFNVGEVSLYANGVQYPRGAFTPSFDEKMYMKEYLALFDNTGIGSEDDTNLITTQQFEDGMTLFAFDLSPDGCNLYHNHSPPLEGNIELKIKFKSALAQPITVFVFGNIQSALSVDKNNKTVVLTGI
ncbi:MAG: hypothetical protein COA94_02415 [Rickettsiales bacterium]|nr:MAG: hypothetical protein COA94_02415 [Rickettsiales bacterium]